MIEITKYPKRKFIDKLITTDVMIHIKTKCKRCKSKLLITDFKDIIRYRSSGIDRCGFTEPPEYAYYCPYCEALGLKETISYLSNRQAWKAEKYYKNLDDDTKKLLKPIGDTMFWNVGYTVNKEKVYEAMCACRQLDIEFPEFIVKQSTYPELYEAMTSGELPSVYDSHTYHVWSMRNYRDKDKDKDEESETSINIKDNLDRTIAAIKKMRIKIKR
jgi:hypothetical protein